MPVYSAYGLNIACDFPLGELPFADGEPEVSVRVAPISEPWSIAPGEERAFQKTGEGILLSWTEYSRFLVKGGREILVEPVPGCDEGVLRHLLLGPVMGALNHQRGLALFHASAVALPTGAVAFFGKKGYGKSTQAAAFVRRGCPLVTDDLLLLSRQESGVSVMPGVPFLKLWPPSMDMMGENPDHHPLVKANLEKRALSMQQNAIQSPAPMRAVYILDHGPQIEIKRLSPREALLRIMPHWYGAIFGSQLMSVMGIDRQLLDCALVANCLPVFLLKRPVDMSRLPEICEAIECSI